MFLEELSQNRKKAEKFVPKLKKFWDISGWGMLIVLFQPKWSKLECNTHRCIECPIKSKFFYKVAKEEIEFFNECLNITN